MHATSFSQNMQNCSHRLSRHQPQTRQFAQESTPDPTESSGLIVVPSSHPHFSRNYQQGVADMFPLFYVVLYHHTPQQDCIQQSPCSGFIQELMPSVPDTVLQADSIQTFRQSRFTVGYPRFTSHAGAVPHSQEKLTISCRLLQGETGNQFVAGSSGTSWVPVMELVMSRQNVL